MSTIDNRIVDMQFNNKQFEDGIATTLTSLDGLKKGLGNLEGASRGLDEMGDTTSGLGLKFSALETMAVTALVKITSAALDFGASLAKSITIDPIIAGFSQYEEKIGSMKAIMNATKMTAVEIGEAMEGVIFYADETSFSFNQMSTAIRLFTSSGIAIEDAVQQIMGLGSAAALAGVPMEKMESVFDSVSKAIGQGSVKIREWDTLSNAGLTTSIEFKQILLDTAVSMGTLTKSGEEYIANYVDPISGKAKAMNVSLTDMRTALKSGWLDKAVLQETLVQFGDYANDVFLLTEHFTENSEALLAKYGKTMEDVYQGVGATGEEAAEINRLMTEEAYSFDKALLTVKNTSLVASQAMDILSDGTEHFGERGMRAAQEARTLSETIQSVVSAVGTKWRDTWELLIGDVDEATELFGNIVEVLWDLFVSAGEARNAMLSLWRGVDEGDIDGRTVLLEGLANVGNSLIAIIGAIQEAWQEIFPPMTGEKLLDLTMKFRDFSERLVIGDEALERIKDGFSGMFSGVALVIGGVSAFIEGIKGLLKAFDPLIYVFFDTLDVISDYLWYVQASIKEGFLFGDALKNLKESFDRLAFAIFLVIQPIATFIQSLVRNDSDFDTFGRILSGLAAALDLVVMGFTMLVDIGATIVGNLLFPLCDTTSDLTRNIEELVAKFGDFIVGLRDSAKESAIFEKISLRVGGVIRSIRDFIVELTITIKEGFSSLADKVTDAIARIKNAFGTSFGAIDLTPLTSAFEKLRGIDTSPLDELSDKVEARIRPFEAIGKALGVIFETIVKVLEWAAPLCAKLGGIIANAFGGLINAVTDAVMNNNFSGLVDLLNTGLFAAIVLGVKKFLESLTSVADNATSFMSHITGILDGVRGSLEAYQSKLKAQTLITIAGAIAILVAALVVLSLIDSAKLTVALAGITTLFIELTGTMLVLSKSMGAIKLGGVAVQMVAISAAILILSVVMKSLAELSWEDIVQGGVAIAALSAILVLTAESMSKNVGKITAGSVSMIAMATAILILSQAVKSLADLDMGQLTLGLIGVGVLMGEVSQFSNLVKPEKLVSTGVAMIAIGAALKIMASAVGDLGEIPIDQLIFGVGALGVVLAEVAGFSRIIKPNQLVSTGVAMIAMGASLKIIASAVGDFGSLKFEELVKGLSALGAVLIEIGAFTQIVNPEKIFTTGLAMIALGAALLIIAQALQSFGSMTYEELCIGLAALAGSLILISAAVNTMTGGLPGAAAMLVMSAAILALVPSLKMLGAMDLDEIGKALLALVGVFAVVGGASFLLAPLTPMILALAAAIALLGVGVLAIGAGLLAFSAGLTALAVAGTAGAAALVVVVTSLLSLIPMALEKLGEGVVAFAGVITNGIPAIMEAVKAIALGLVQVLTEITPQVVTALLKFINEMLKQLKDSVPEMVDSGMKLLAGILSGIAANIKDVVSAALLVVAEFLKGIADGVPDIVASGVDIVVAFLEAIGKETPRIIDAGFKMVIDFINGIADTIRDNVPTLVKAVGNLGSAMIEGLVGGLLGGVTAAVDAVKNVGNAVIDGFKGILGIHSPSTVFAEFGENTDEGYAKGVEDGTPLAEEAIKKMADATINAAYDSFESDGERSALFENLGITNAESFIDGLTLMGSAIKDSLEKVFGADEDTFKAMSSIVDDTLTTIENRISSYTDIATDRFSRISVESETSVADMITNLKFNQMAIAEWADNIALLAERGLDDGLLEELRQAGPKSAGEVIALVEASDKELQELNTVFRKGGEVATNALAVTVGQGAPLMIEPGQSLVDAIAMGLTGDTSLNDAMALLINGAKDIALGNLSGSEFEAAGESIPEGISVGIVSGTDDVTKAITVLGIKAINGASSVGEDVTKAAVKGLNSNSDEYKKTGDLYGTEFANALSNKQVAANTSGKNITNQAESGLKYNNAAYRQTGDKYGLDFSSGISSKDATANQAGKTVSASAEQGIKSNQAEFGKTGIQNGADFADGINSKQSDAYNAGVNLADEGYDGVSTAYNKFYNAGMNAGRGFANGILSMLEQVRQAARDLANASAGGAEDGLDENSPSRVFAKIGQYAGLGFINGLSSMTSAVADSAVEMGSSAIQSMKDVISEIADVVNSDLDATPVIRPVLDMSEVYEGAESMNRLFGGKRLSTVGISSKASNISSQMSRNGNPDAVSDGGQSGNDGKTFSFVQNNYSPKALTRLEIYRQTRNQFAQMKGLVEGA